MTMTTAQLVRSRINDMPRYDTEILLGDGTASAFKLKQGTPHSMISAGTITASVPVAAGWSATGATFDVTAGIAIFSGVPSANSAIQCSYQWSVFSEDELSYFTSLGGIPQATLGAVNHLLTNYAKRGSWASPDGSTYSDVQALASLMQVRSALIAEIRGAEIGPDGTTISWSEEQGNFLY